MRRQIEKLYPSSLKRLDHYLLINHPVLWGTRLHIVAFFSAIYTSICLLVALSIPASLSFLVDPRLFMTYGLIVSGLVGLIWIFSAYSFRVDKFMGKSLWLKSLEAQAYYLLIVILLSAGPIASSWVYTARVASLSTLEQLIQDSNTLNRGYHCVRENYSRGMAYNHIGDIFSDDRTYWSGKYIYSMLINASEEQATQYLEEAKKTFARYGGDPSSPELKERFWFFSINNYLRGRMRILGSVHLHNYRMQHLGFCVLTVLISLGIVYAAMVFYQFDVKHVFFSLVILAGLSLIVWGLASAVLPAFCACLLWCGLFVRVVFMNTLSSSNAFHVPLLFITSLATPIPLYFLYLMIDELSGISEAINGRPVYLLKEFSIFAGVLAAMCTLFLWNSLYQPKLISSSVAPKGK